jgi:hypothetical protein
LPYSDFFFIFPANVLSVFYKLFFREAPMLTTMLLLAACIAMPQVQPSIPAIKNGNIAEHGSSKKTEERQKQNPVESPKILCNGCSVQTQPSTETDKENSYNPQRDALYRAYLIATIIGVLIALAGIGFIWRQNKHIQRQTGHLESQITIQQRSSRQWVNISGWQQHLADGMANTIEVSFQIENPTPIPLRLDGVMYKANGTNGASGLVTFLPPENPFPHQLHVILNKEQTALYEKAKLVLETEVSVFFTDAFDNQWNQVFERILVCGHHNNQLYVRESRTRMHRSGPNDSHEE